MAKRGRRRRIVTASGFSGTLGEHAERLGCQLSTLYTRCHRTGWTVETVIEHIARYGHKGMEPRTTQEQRLIEQARAQGWAYRDLRRRLPWRPDSTVRGWFQEATGRARGLA